MTTTIPTTPDRTAAELLVYRPLDPRWGDAAALAELRAIRAARSRRDEHDRRAEAGHRRPHGQHRGPGLRLFGHRFA